MDTKIIIAIIRCFSLHVKKVASKRMNEVRLFLEDVERMLQKLKLFTLLIKRQNNSLKQLGWVDIIPTKRKI